MDTVDDDLESTWTRVSQALAPRWQVGGVTYHGPEASHRWVAFLVDDSGFPGGPEGRGTSAIAALDDLLAKVRHGDSD